MKGSTMEGACTGSKASYNNSQGTIVRLPCETMLSQALILQFMTFDSPVTW